MHMHICIRICICTCTYTCTYTCICICIRGYHHIWAQAYWYISESWVIPINETRIYVRCLKYSILWCIPCTCILLIYRSGWGMLEVGWGLDVRIRLILFQKHCPMISHSFSPLVPKSHSIDSWLFMRRSLYNHNSFYWCLQPIRITEFGHVTSQGYATHGSLETGS